MTRFAASLQAVGAVVDRNCGDECNDACGASSEVGDYEILMLGSRDSGDLPGAAPGRLTQARGRRALLVFGRVERKNETTEREHTTER
jgi:hypothetical protein